MSRSPRFAPTPPHARLRRAIAAALLIGGLVACGGGGGSDGGGVVVPPPPPPVDTGPDLRGLSCSAGDGQGWCWQRPQPLGVSVADVVFVDALNGWASGDSSRVLRTVDGGRTWSQENAGLGDQRAIGWLAFASPTEGWATVRGFADILRTMDGGRTWTAVAPAPMQVATSVRWLGARRLLVQGVDGYRFNVPTAALSEDGGSSWKKLPFDYAQADGTLWAGDTRSTDFGRSFARAPGWLPGLTGVVGGGNSQTIWARGTVGATRYLGVTADGGQTFVWSSADLPPSFGDAFIDQPAFFAKGRGWAIALGSVAAQRALITTSDWGRTWARISWPAGVEPDFLLRILIVDDGTVFLSRGLRRWVTRNGGASWADPGLPTEAGEIALARADEGGGLQVRDVDGRWYRWRDAAPGWSTVALSLPAQPALMGLWFFDRQRGLALTDDGALYGTTDAGRTWALRTRLGDPRNEPSWQGFLSNRAGWLQFRSGTGWLVDGDRRLRRSTDGGATWVAIGVGNSIEEFVRSVQFLDAQKGFATTLQCQDEQPASCVHWLHVTANAGGTWQRLPVPLGGASSLMAFADAQRGVRMDEQAGQMYFTTDGGRSWLPASDEADRGGTPHRVTMSSDGTGWLLGNDGVRRTRDFGRSWQSVKVDLPAIDSVGIYFPLPQDIAFGDVQNGWLLASNGVVMTTNDGGATWRRQGITTQLGLSTVFALDAQRAWIGGENGVLFGTVTGGQ